MTGQELRKIDQVIETYSNGQQNLIHVLQDINSEFGYLPEEGLRHVSRRMGIPLSEVYGMATFFKSFRLKPRGRHLVTVCMGTACHVRGAPRIAEKMERELCIHHGETTEDLRFTLETVNCVGACALGPMVIVDGNYNGQTSTNQVEALLKEYD
ncbi:NADH-quinone oxidoreductase subunit NuoE [Chloroflexota bacterium]